MATNGKKKNVELKILLLGDQNVGKTTLLLKYLQGEFIVNLDITWKGVNLFRKTISKEIPSEEGVNYIINIWDIAGSDTYIDFFSLITQPMNAIIILVGPDQPGAIEYSIKRWNDLFTNMLDSSFLKFLIINNRNAVSLDSQILDSIIRQYQISKYFIVDIKDTAIVNSTFESIFNDVIEILNYF